MYIVASSIFPVGFVLQMQLFYWRAESSIHNVTSDPITFIIYI